MKNIFQKLIIYFLTIIIVLANFSLLLTPKKASAASISFAVPGQWYLDGNTGNLVNKTEMTKEGKKESVKWEYYPAGGKGMINYSINQPISANIYRLASPQQYIPDLGKYYIFIIDPSTSEPNSKIGYLGAISDNNSFDFRFITPAGIEKKFHFAQGSAETELGQYLQQLKTYLGTNNIYMESQAPTGITPEAKQACADLLITPEQGLNVINEAFTKINGKMGKTVLNPINAGTNSDLFHKFFQSNDNLDYSDTYLALIGNPSAPVLNINTYQDATNIFHHTEVGLTWFWSNPYETATEKDFLPALIAGSFWQKVGGVWALSQQFNAKIVTLPVQYFLQKANQNRWQELGTLLATKAYLEAHMEYDRCIARNVTDQAFKDMVEAEEINFKALLGIIDQQVLNYIEAQQTADASWGNTCGVNAGNTGSVPYFIAAALCAILEFMGDVAGLIVDTVFGTVFDTYAPEIPHLTKFALPSLFVIQKAHAADAEALTPLDKAFTNDPANQWPWVIKVWKWTLGLANLFLVVVLLFLGVVNILHIQYDTYAIKKMLPLLIIGVILANFSLLIMRMLVDASNILTKSFMDGSPGTAVHNLITAVNVDSGSFTENKGFWANVAGDWKTVGGLFLAVIFSFFAVVAFFILGIMFYIRFAAIVLLGIIAPLAFVAMAFPPTQTVFKQWWSWTSKMVFMKPIAMFLIAFATMVHSGPDAVTSITAWIIIIALVYMAILVPWKLGGVVMGLWGGAMGSLFGTKKGGYARKPVEEWWDRRKNRVGSFFIRKFPGIAGRGELDKEETELARKEAVGKAKKYVEERGRGKTARKRRLAQEAEENLKKTQEEQMLGVETGKLKQMKKFLWSSWLGKIRFRMETGARSEGELATRFKRSTADMQKATEAVQKSRQWDLFTLLGSDQRDNNHLVSKYKKMKDQGNGLAGYNLDENGNPDFKEGPPEKTAADYMQDAMQLRRRAATEKDLEKQRNLYSTADLLDQGARAWQDANLTFEGEMLRHDVLLDNNLRGRILKLITPLLIDEQHTMAQNTNLDGFEGILEGAKNGGFGEITHNFDDLTNVALRKYSRFSSADPINAAICTMGALREKMAGSPTTTESQAFTALAYREMAKILARDPSAPEGGQWWGRLLEHLDSTEGGMPGLIAGVAVEESRDLIKRGKKPIIDKPEDYVDRRGQIDIGKVYDDVPWEDLVTKITPEMVGGMRLTTGDSTTRFRREFFTRSRTAFFQQPEFAGGENPANIGSKVEDEPLFTTLKRRESTPPPNGYQAPPEEPPVGPVGGGAQTAERQAAALWENPDAAILAQRTGGYTKAAENYLNGAELLRSMGQDLARHFRVPSGINLDANLLNQLTRRLSELNISLDIDGIEAELKKIHPEISLDRDLSVTNYIDQAQRITKGSDNYAELAMGTLADDCFPYAKGAINKNSDEISNEIGKLTAATEFLADEVAKIKESGGKQGVSDEAIQKIVGPIEQLRGGGVNLNIANLKETLRQGSFGPVSEILDKYQLVLRAIQKIQSLPADQRMPLNATNIKKAIIEGVQESALERRQAEAGETPPPTPPGGPGQTPPAGPPIEEDSGATEKQPPEPR